MLHNDEWIYCSYGMFKTQRALFIVQVCAQAQCCWLDKKEPMNCLGCYLGVCHMDLLEKRHMQVITINVLGRRFATMKSTIMQ